MISCTTRRFRELFDSLPAHVQSQSREAYRLFQQDPHHPGLRFKRVDAGRHYYSARVGIGYRVVGVREGNTIVWFWIGSHADYDRLLATL